MFRTSAIPSRITPAVLTIAVPEGIRGGTQQDADQVDSFSQQDFDSFLQGYQSQYKELSFWVEEDAIEGVTCVAKSVCYTCKLLPAVCLTALFVLTLLCTFPYCMPDSIYSALPACRASPYCLHDSTYSAHCTFYWAHCTCYWAPNSTQSAHCTSNFSLVRV